MDINKEDHIMTIPKKGLKTRPYNMDMSKEDHITTLPKRGLKTRLYNMDMNERDLEKLSKSELIKLLLKQKKSKKVRNHEDVLDNDPFKDEVAQPIAQREPAKRIKLRDPITGRFVKINPEVPKPPTLPRLRDVKGRFISRQPSEPVVQQEPAKRIKPPKPTRKPPPPPILQVEEKEHITNVSSSKIKELKRALKNHAKSYEN